MKRPTYTLSSMIKKVFRSGERSLPREEICSRLEESGLIAHLDMEAEALLTKVLQMKQSPVRVGRTDAIVEVTYQPHQLFDLAFRYLRDTQTPKTLEQIVAELRRQTQFGWNQITRLLQLDRDLRFVQFQGDVRWFLADWTVANDQVYQFCRSNGIAQISSRSLGHFLEQEAKIPPGAVFLPPLDDRFRLEGERLHIIVREDDICAEEEQEAEEDLLPGEDGGQVEWEIEEARLEAAPAAAPDEAPVSAPGLTELDTPGYPADAKADESSESPEATELQHEHHEQLHFEEEVPMNSVQTQSTIQEVQEMLRLALDRLQARNAEMSQEVVSHFQKSNMQAIELLMKEKHKNEQLALGIEQVLTASQQQ